MKKLFIIICVFLSFCSCEQETNLPYPDAVPATFTPVMAELAPMETSPAEWNSISTNITRVNNNEWSGNETVGIAAFDYTSGTQVTTKFHQYTPNNGMNGTHVQLVTVSNEDPICYPINGDKITFKAFAPYVAPVNNAVTYDLSTQSSAATNNLEQLDFIYHWGATGYSQNVPIATLNFRHRLSRVVINLTRSNNYPSSIADATAVVTGVPTSVVADLLTGGVTSSGSGSITPYRSHTTAEKVTFQAIVAPQSSLSTPSASDREITFTVGGYNYTVDIPQEFEEGKSYKYDFVFDASGVTLAGSKVFPWGGGTVAWNENYYLRIAQNEIILPSAAGTDNKLVMASNYDSDPVISFRSGEDPTSAAITWLSSPTLAKSTSGSEYIYTLTYASASNTATRSTPRTGYIHIATGTLTSVVKVTQQGIVEPEANCYILPPGGSIINIPVSRANTFVPNSITGAFGWQLIWTDVSVNGTNGAPHANAAIASVTTSGTGNNGCLVVRSGSQEGNAVIAVTVGNGANRIKWSWHIWVTKYNPLANGKVYTNTNGETNTFMDRNLGALNGTNSLTPEMGTPESIGLFYQWGRKDPFPGSGSTTTNTEKIVYTATDTATVKGNKIWGQVSMVTAVRNPFMFYNFSGPDGESRDWCSDTVNSDDRWGHTSSTKTVYDPCPNGWRVPHRYALTGHTVDNLIYSATLAGSYHEQTGWYPRTGRRVAGNGTLSEVHQKGYWWTSGHNGGTSGRPLVFIEDSEVKFTGNESTSRGNGFAIRCVLEK